MFGSTPDPDFLEAMLLEQYQAQISSALTPAFASDSSPELAAEAVNVCATFISTGIVTDIDRMGRILKLLVSALDTFASMFLCHYWSVIMADNLQHHPSQHLSAISKVSARMHKSWSEWPSFLPGLACRLRPSTIST